MALLFGALWPLERLNGGLLAICRVIAIVALILMVTLILGQVFFRYVLDAAPAWTEEGARFCMLWMTGLMAPLAYRQGGFVAIDMFENALPRKIGEAFALLLLLVSLTVLVYALEKGIFNHVFSLTGRGTAPSLRVPLSLFGGEDIRFRNSWAYASLAVGLALLILVNLELVLRQLIRMAGGGDRLAPLGDASMARAD
jgi:TRAP-type C4-dicarboxylate transport system permease small subunit